MKVNWNILYYVFSAILISVIVMLLHRYKTNMETEFDAKYSKLKSECDLVEDVLSNNLINSNSYIGFQFNDDIIIEDTAFNKVKLTNVINGQNVLIYRISNTHCSTCDETGIESLLSTSSNIPHSSIVIIGSFYNTQLLNSYIAENNIEHSCYNLKQSINFKAEEFNFPYFIVVNKNLEVLSCFFPEKSKPYLTEYFFLGVKHLFHDFE